MRGGYLAVDVQGSLIPQDVLSRIAAGDHELPGMRPEDYYLAASERLGDAASRHWDYLLGAYRAFRDKLAALPESDVATTLTRERWLLILFQELGFGRIPFNQGSMRVGGKDFPISHLWNSVPMHLLGWRSDLDKSVPGVTKRAPQSMLQEFLNLSDDHLWAVLSNGRQLRILRDSTALVGSAYVEFDLEAIFEGELYSEFVVLYTLQHASRFELIAPQEGSPTCADCWLEKWRAFAAETGMRARDQLRDGLKTAMEALGTGFLVANPKLREQLESGALTRDDFRHELLRLAYQLIFIFVAEDRNALLNPYATTEVRDRYDTWFSGRRMRRLAVRRSGDRHRDLWKTAVMVIKALGADEGMPELGLPGLGGLFFRTADAPGVLGDQPFPDQLLWCDLPNEAFLTAIRNMSTVRAKDGRPRDVDFQHLGAEELGSIYESLLELVPYAISNGNPRFELREKVSGNDRKLTGSYYTPTSLIESLLDTALEPIIDEHAASGNPEDLLKITVCDPACGSGHFLVGAARRIAKRYAAMVTGEDEPVPSEVRKAMHKVAEKCIYGVDLQPQAVELAQVSLWIESLAPGRPLAFLDAHIKVGNALIGSTPRLIKAGVPESAFKALVGDSGSVVADLKKANKQALSGTVGRGSGRYSAGMSTLFDDAEVEGLTEALETQARAYADVPVLSVADAREQERRFREYDQSPKLARKRLIADAWCAAFVWRKHEDAPPAITTATLRSLDRGGALSPRQEEELRKLVDQYRFFHWHLEFPEVFAGNGETNPLTGWRGGFTCVLGNPPWEKVKLSEKEFFAGRNDEIANAGNKNARDKLIKALANSDDGKALYEAFTDAKRRAEGESHFLRASERYPLTARGDVNTYAIFSENNRTVLHPQGRLGIIVPTGIATDATTQFFFKDLVMKKSLASLYDFENRRKIFAQVDSRVKFSLLTLAGSQRQEDKAEFAFFLHDALQLGDKGKRFTLTPKEITLLNPNTGTCPVFRTRRDAEITLGIYLRVPILLKEGDPDGNPWGIKFMTMFHMSNDSHLFRPNEANGETLETMLADGWTLDGNILVKGKERLLPLYEGKMGHQYDHRAAEFYGMGDTDLQTVDRDPRIRARPRYWVSEALAADRLGRRRFDCNSALLGHRRVARSTDERTAIASLLPWGPASYGWIVSAGPAAEDLAVIVAAYNSFAYDFTLRNALSQPSVPQGTSEQLPVPAPAVFAKQAPWSAEDSVGDWIRSRTLELAYSASDMQSFARDLGDVGGPFVWDEQRRASIRAELDAAFFHLYGVTRDDVDYILDTFPIVKRKDEAKYGEYRTKRLILELYDAIQDAIDERKPYQTPLNPPPGHGPRHPTKPSA